jgi:hypothetical protein
MTHANRNSNEAGVRTNLAWRVAANALSEAENGAGAAFAFRRF